MKSVTIVFLIIILLQSCTKKTQVVGKIYNAANIPVPYANILIFKEPYGWQITTSDVNGNYEFSFSDKKTSNYTISASKPPSYFSKSKPITIGKIQTIDLYP